MEILNIKVLRGPNYWSNTRKQLIVMMLDLKEYEQYPTHKLPGFPAALKALLPSLYHHRCSEGEEGGFFKRLEEGTWLGHVIEHIALELQWLAGMQCGYGRTRVTAQAGIYHVVFAYEVENAGIYAAKAAVAIAAALVKQMPYIFLSEDIKALQDIARNEDLGPSTKAIILEAQKRNIPCTRLDNGSLVMLGHGCQQKLICAALTDHTSIIGAEIASDKKKTKKILSDAFIPVPKSIRLQSAQDLEQALTEFPFPWVIKPIDGNHGRGITTNITGKEKAYAAYELAKKISNNLMIEAFIAGFDYRFLVVNYQLVAVAKRLPPMIMGNGKDTVLQLIDKLNQDPNRGEDHETYLTRVKVDDITLNILAEHQLTLASILPKNQIIYLKHAANLSSGGTATDVTDTVHPYNVFLAERIARLLHLDICGIDILAKDITLPLAENNGAVLEVNASPGLRMHLNPQMGAVREVGKPIIDMLYPNQANGRIPLVAVTGTNGKTTTVRLIAHLAQQAGYCVGATTTEGIYINQQEIFRGDCSGPFSAKTVLRDPIVDFAVLECARGGILSRGLGFDQCSVSIVTNISEDHLGLDDIHTLEDLARVKEVVPRSTIEEGYAILNADDDLVYAMKDSLSCYIALFSLKSDKERIVQHCRQQGLAAYINEGVIVVQKGESITPIAKVADIPMTFSGYAECMVQNILPVVLTGIIYNMSVDTIVAALHTFQLNSDINPGRMNLFDFGKFTVMLDYAHNEAAFIYLQKYLSHLACTRKIGIIAGTGDRSLEAIKKVGFYAAQMFDEVIIRHDRDGRGKSNQELTSLICEGIQEAAILPMNKVKVISQEQEAIQYAMQHAVSGSFIFYFPEDVPTAVDFLKKSQKARHKSAIIF